jgi:hypothetical protein
MSLIRCLSDGRDVCMMRYATLVTQLASGNTIPPLIFLGKDDLKGREVVAFWGQFRGGNGPDPQRGTKMLTNGSVKPHNPGQPNESIDNKVREVARGDAASRPRGAEAVSQVTGFLQNVAGSSVQEIDRLITELQALRALLHAEGVRVQREINEYAHLNNSAMQSIKIIGESMASWRQSDPRNTRR